MEDLRGSEEKTRAIGAVTDSGNTPAVSLSGKFAQPSGAFAQPSGAFAQPTGAIAEFERVAQEYREISEDYDVGEAIGRGGCAVVLEAWRKVDRMHVVIKVIQISAGFDEKETHIAIARFMREAELIASLHEEHIVKCVDYGCFQGTPCMVLEYVDGLSLDRLIVQYGSIPLEFSAGIIRQLLSALAETHGRKIIHRDIKPSNIMVFDSPPPFVIRVLDFGISSVQDGLQSQTLMTQQGNVRGTPSYMAPELFTGETCASIESDLYAVGLVFYECLTGEIAFNDKSFMRVAYKQVNEMLEVPGNIPRCIADIIYRLCEKKAENRYHSAEEVIADLDANIGKALKEEEKCAKEWEKGRKGREKKKKKKANSEMQMTTQGVFSPKNRGKSIVLFVLIVAVLVGTIVYLLQPPAQEPQAQDDVAAQVDAEAREKVEKLKIKGVRDGASFAVSNAWNSGVQAILLAEKELEAEKAKAAAAAAAAAPAPAPAPAPKPSSSKKRAPSAPSKKASSGRIRDGDVDLPF